MALKEEKVHVASGKKKASVRRETSAVSGMRVTIVHQNRHWKPLHPLSRQWHEVEARREKEASEAEVRLAEYFDNRAGTIWKVLVRDHFVSIGILPNVNSVRLNPDAKLVTSVCSRTTRLKNNPVTTENELLTLKTDKATTRVL